MRRGSTDWRDYIGKYYLKKLENDTLSDPEFEKRTYDLLCALGFDVIQKVID